MPLSRRESPYNLSPLLYLLAQCLCDTLRATYTLSWSSDLPTRCRIRAARTRPRPTKPHRFGQVRTYRHRRRAFRPRPTNSTSEGSLRADYIPERLKIPRPASIAEAVREYEHAVQWADMWSPGELLMLFVAKSLSSESCGRALANHTRQQFSWRAVSSRTNVWVRCRLP